MEDYSEFSNGWDPSVPNQLLRIRDNPGRIGLTTGRTQRAGTRLLVQVRFGPNEVSYKQYELLELVPADEEFEDLIRSGSFGHPDDLRRLLVLEKIKGNLTNVFYSMESSNTEFFPHQFKPVLRFIESPMGRLLIADEVGLGKTIEAIYVWKELQAREDARRLLVICPAMLCEKWRSDLLSKFNITAKIIDASTLLADLRSYKERETPHSFVHIASLEGLRPPHGFEDERINTPRAQLGRLLDGNPSSGDSSLLDLTIIDEAHYLRNVGTASNRLGRLVRDCSRRLLLLTATPVQIHSSNLYQLLRLIDPGDFYDEPTFQAMLQSNVHIIRALRSVWHNPPDIHSARDAVHSALESPYFHNNSLLEHVQNTLNLSDTLELHSRVTAARLLESCSLLGQYMNRSRKRDVLEERVERSAQTLAIRFSPLERKIYERVKQRIINESSGQGVAVVFRLVTRLRQLSSSMPAAIAEWNDKGHLEELLWDDLGSLATEDSELETGAQETPSLSELFQDGIPDAQMLEGNDAKYSALLKVLEHEIHRNPKEKFVIFAFFRATLRYLERRLRANGLKTCLIMGGEDKWKEIRRFCDPDGPNILLSSEVGSEGIDLQFCRFLVNYDLPWNPMRVEQRIGRLDRLGQKASRITIINFALEDTIEERILGRLYERIEIFKESIGDLEEILGEYTESLIMDLLRPELTDAERERRIDDLATTILNRRKDQERLEGEAVNLLAFSDFILDSIKTSRERGLWLSPDEVTSFVDDFFRHQYPGTAIEHHPTTTHAYRIRLADDAKSDLNRFIMNSRPGTPTRLGRSLDGVDCIFDPRRFDYLGNRYEVINAAHPFIQWIKSVYESGRLRPHPVSAIQVSCSLPTVEPGPYAYFVALWSFKGIRTENRIVSQIFHLEGDHEPPSHEISEEVILLASRKGAEVPNPVHRLPDRGVLLSRVKDCFDCIASSFDVYASDFEAENAHRCNIQEQSARAFAERRRTDLTDRIRRFEEEGRRTMIPATKGLLSRVESELRLKIELVNQKRVVEPTLTPLSMGVIFVN